MSSLMLVHHQLSISCWSKSLSRLSFHKWDIYRWTEGLKLTSVFKWKPVKHKNWSKIWQKKDPNLWADEIKQDTKTLALKNNSMWSPQGPNSCRLSLKKCLKQNSEKHIYKVWDRTVWRNPQIQNSLKCKKQN